VPTSNQGPRRRPSVPTVLAGLLLGLLLLVSGAGPADAQSVPVVPQPELPVPTAPVPGGVADADDTPATGGGVQIGITTGEGEGPSQSILLLIGLSVLSLAPSLVLLLSSFTRIVIVLSLTRNALGLQGIPPNQVLIGLALFLSLFVMAPTLSEVNEKALQPYLAGEMEQGEAFDAASGPIKAFMLDNTRTDELQLMIDATGGDRPDTRDDVSLTTVIPAFLLSELKTAFIMGFVIFVPFLVIDLVVSAVLMSLGMMMLPPVFVSLPFKLLLFVMVGGWSLIVETLLASFS
jgi:flagellar biosynthetic protein FliP